MSTPILGMPELASGQAIPETTVNEIARILEQGAHAFSVKDKDLSTPPGSPTDGDAYIVAGSPTGAWTGHAGKVAWRMSTAWEFIAPSEGMFAWVQDENKLYVYQPSAWAEYAPNLAIGLDDLDDVSVGSPDLGEVLTWDGGEWVAAPAPGSGGGSGGTVPNGGTTGQKLVKLSGVDQDIGWGGGFRGALAYRSGTLSGQNFTSGFTAIELDAESYDTDNIHDNATNNTRMTVPTGVSKIRLTGQVQITGITTNLYMQVAILKAGSAAYVGAAVSSTANAGNGTPRSNASSPVLSVSPGDYFELGINVQTDTSVDVSTNGSTWLAMEIIE